MVFGLVVRLTQQDDVAILCSRHHLADGGMRGTIGSWAGPLTGGEAGGESLAARYRCGAEVKEQGDEGAFENWTVHKVAEARNCFAV